MADVFPKSVVLHFPPNVYQKIGAQEMFPRLLKVFKAEDLSCIQFVRGGKVRVSFREKSVRDYHLSEGVRFDGQVIPVTRDADKVAFVYLRDLPYEVAEENVSDFFKTYGEVLAVERSVSAEFPSLYNGNRVIKMILKDPLPYFLSVCGCNCRVWYRDQPVQCFVCREVGHRAQSCPLSGRCRRCHQPGHVARDCTWAWDPVPPAVVDDSEPVAVADTVDPVPLSVDPVDADPSASVAPAPEVSVAANVNVPVPAVHPPPEPVDDPPASTEGSVVSESSESYTKPKSRAMFGLSLPIPREYRSNVTFRMSYSAMREQFLTLRRRRLVKMNSSDLKQFILDTLWAKDISCGDLPVVEHLLEQLTGLRKYLRNHPDML